MSNAAEKLDTASASNASSNRTRLTRCLCIVELDATCKPSVDVYAYEIPILEAIHGGRGMVTVVKKWDKMVENFDIYTEWERLRSRYNKEDKPFVDMVYRNGPGQLAKEAGVEIRKLADGEREPVVFLSSVVDNGDPNGEILPVLERAPKARKGAKASASTASVATEDGGEADQTGF